MEEVKHILTVKNALAVLALVTLSAATFVVVPNLLSTQYDPLSAVAADDIRDDISEPSVIHVPTPESVRAVYMTSWVAGTPEIRERVVRLIEETEINAVIIDIKDDTGNISYEVADPALRVLASYENRIPDAQEFIEQLHEKGIYVIGRISVFQDPFFTEKRPDLAVQKESDKSVWTDYKGLSFIDVGARDFWEYITALSRDAYALGFDEINYDYIRFPSDGNMQDIFYPVSEERLLANTATGMADALEEFFRFLYQEMKAPNTTVSDGTASDGPVISADLFGMTTTNPDDLNIGQVIERALPYFDYIMPMVYPSHYPATFQGFDNPAKHPYEVVHFSMSEAVRRANELAWNASTTPHSLEAQVTPHKLRPWLQDFDLGALYTPEMVRAQIQATYDAGLTSWALWDAANTYTKEALEIE